jgi:nucleoside-diphosphate-sugar epimerase
MRVFVTGATGVIGRRVVPMLRRSGWDVTAVARSPEGRRQVERHGAVPVHVDLFDVEALIRAVAGHDAVINLATHIPRGAKVFLRSAWRENDRLRREASSAIADACTATAVGRLIQESFAPVYPDRHYEWIDETTPLEPVRYNRSVLDAEAAAARVSKSGRAGVVLRFAAFYGADATQTADVVSWVKRGRAPLPGDAAAFISSVSHDDAAAAVVAALTAPAGVYNIADDEPVTHRMFVDALADALGVPPPKLPPRWATPLFGSLGAMLARSLRISNARFRDATSWAPQWASVRQGWPAVVARLGRGVAAV